MIRTMTALICAAGLLSPLPGLAQTCPDPAGRLDQAVSRLQDAVKSHNAAALLSLIGDRGLVLGADGPQMSKAELAAAFKARRGAYCELFVCAGRTGRLKRLLIAANPVKRIHQPRNGNVFAVATLKRGHPTDETELSFAQVDCRWELTAIGTL